MQRREFSITRALQRKIRRTRCRQSQSALRFHRRPDVVSEKEWALLKEVNQKYCLTRVCEASKDTVTHTQILPKFAKVHLHARPRCGFSLPQEVNVWILPLARLDWRRRFTTASYARRKFGLITPSYSVQANADCITCPPRLLSY